MSKANVSINVEHLTRVEGHGNIVVDVKDGEVKKCLWEVTEAPRFFEAMVRGRRWDELHHITARICGICSIGHTFASLKATEKALDVQVTEQTVKLRKLLLHMENLQSHILHVGYLVVPDLFGVGSVIPLASSHPDEVLTVVRVHRLSNEVCDIVGGRTTHPIRCTVGGWTMWPTVKELQYLKKRFLEGVEDLKALAGVVKSVAGKIPPFERETEYIGLVSDEEYALYDGDIGSTDAGRFPVEEYLDVTNEFIVRHSTAKHAKNKRDAYMVGALARFNLNHKQLTPLAKEVAEMLGLKAICTNPYMISVAQVVECVHSVEDSIRLTDELLADGIKDEKPSKVEVKAGRGIASDDVPRGILFHDYEYDKDGLCVAANGVIPTNQNHENIQKDLEALVPSILDKDEKEIELFCEMLVRAYDPCISCSAHAVKVKLNIR